jgi:type VI secretion system protein ImpK
MTAASLQAQRVGATTSTFIAHVRAAEGASNPMLEAARTLLDALANTPAGLDASSIEQHRQWLVREVQMFGKICSTLPLPSPQVDKARYCLCSALDEAAALTDWGNGSGTGIEWETNGLASTCGYDRQGSDRVFTIVNDCMREPQKNRDLIEVIQQILSRGFKGRYRFVANGDHQIEAVREDIRDAISRGSLGVRVLEDEVQASDSRPPSQRPINSPRATTPASRSRRWPAAAAFCLSLLAIISGVVYWRYAQVNPPPLISPLDALASRLTGRLASETRSGNVTLAENTEHTKLTLRLEGIFEAGESTVNPWVEPTIFAIGQEIARAHGRILITGHTDDQPFGQTQRGSNLALSDARAREVAQILVAAGVPTDRIESAGKGNAEPAADNTTRQGRARNRRVEMVVSE